MLSVSATAPTVYRAQVALPDSIERTIAGPSLMSAGMLMAGTQYNIDNSACLCTASCGVGGCGCGREPVHSLSKFLRKTLKTLHLFLHISPEEAATQGGQCPPCPGMCRGLVVPSPHLLSLWTWA